ncbi:MAG: hypothetical protein LBB60_05410 [Desulfovibrio sp.]|nr:hypothetical protein [Desulfovibrio sp.]
MKPSVAGLLFAIIFFVGCENQEKKEQAYLEETFRLYQERHEDTAAIAGLLTKGLLAYPNSFPLLQARANLYCSRRMLSECRADTHQLLELKPSLIEAKMMLCMLDEFEGVARQIDETCYREVATIYAALPSTSSPDLEIGNKFNYVVALLMARHPNAEQEKAAFLSKVASEPQAWIYHGVLDDFNRERMLREVFGNK